MYQVLPFYALQPDTHCSFGQEPNPRKISKQCPQVKKKLWDGHFWTEVFLLKRNQKLFCAGMPLEIRSSILAP